MKTTAQGQAAESAVAGLLVAQDYQILDRNWRTKTCEIDIVAQKQNVIYFIEVKYRAQADQGDGFEYITSRKLSQMQFAGRSWNAEHAWEGDWRLLAAAVSGPNSENIQLLEI